MGLIPSYSEKVRSALKRPANAGVDALVILGVAGVIAGVAVLLGHAAAPRPNAVQIDLSFGALPRYAFFSVSRAVIAYLLSLLFTLVYGTITAHSRTAEKFMIPVLDVLQSLPVLSFLPGLVLIFVHLFSTSWLGLELACVVMIFTAQAWNMAFSYHASVRSIPDSLREAAAIQRLSGWQSFLHLELPSSMIGLVWNSMMSFAGGWFIITVNEAFTLNGQDYRLPGLGSYMNQAQIDWNVPAMVAGVIAMLVVIVGLDQLVWRPIVVWSQKFKLEDTSSAEQPHSWFLELLRHSMLIKWLIRAWERRHERVTGELIAPSPARPLPGIPNGPVQVDYAAAPPRPSTLIGAIKWIVVVGLATLAVWGTFKLAALIIHLPIHDTAQTKGWTAVLWAMLISFGRVAAAVVIGGIWTLPAGVLIGLSPRWSNRLQPFVQVLASFPAPMIYLMMCALLVGRMHIAFTIGCIFLMLLGTQWYTLFNVIAGAMAIPSDLREAGRVYHLSVWQRWTRIYIPAVFPYLLTGLITAAGGAWNATIVAEEITVSGKTGQSNYFAFGIGSLIDDATTDGNYALLAASVVAMGLTVVLVNRLFWKKLYRLSEERFSLNT
jgi:NitT/TauT family transport system permease protein